MKKLFIDKNGEKGVAFVFIIIAVVLVFSITLVSGAHKFQYSTETPPVAGNPTPTATPTATPAADTAPEKPHTSYFMNVSLTYNANSSPP